MATAYSGTKRTKRRSKRPETPALYDRAKLISDEIWERANKLAEQLAPENPADTEELPEWDQLMILERAALAFSPFWWQEPDALEDLYRLRKKFMGLESEYLRERAKKVRQMQRSLPDPSVTPQSRDFDEMARKAGLS